MGDFGRNQVLAIYGYGIPLLLVFACVIFGDLKSSEFASFVGSYVPIAMGSILGISGVLKAVTSIASGSQNASSVDKPAEK
jgi:amino acid transporter